MIDVSIIFVNYKTEKLLLDCLRSISKYTSGISYECIVVDNCYVEGANQELLAEFPRTQWINSGGNWGFSKGNNIGVEHAQGEYVLFLNADTLIFDNSIFKAWEFLKNRVDFVAIGGIQLDENKHEIPFYSTLNAIRRDFYILPNLPFIQRLIDTFLPKEDFQEGETNNLVGAFILISKANFIKTGKWDEDFFMYAEDAELSFRLAKLGKLAYSPEVKFIHLIHENEYRRTEYSFINRFSIQIQLSNLLWIRKSYGLFPMMLIYLNYLILVPIFWMWKIVLNLFSGKKLLHDTKNQIELSRKVKILLQFFPRLFVLGKGSFDVRRMM
ncbi:MAG: glycosyltransferase family 2 protein [Aquirufa sp.]